MPLTETVTIINNSGKIISTGKELFGIFKEAKDAYSQKKGAIRGEREILQRSATFDATRSGAGAVPDFYATAQPSPAFYGGDGGNTTRGLGFPPSGIPTAPAPVYNFDDYVDYIDDDGRSRASHRSGRTARTSRTRRSRSQAPSRSRQHHDAAMSRPALTENNLKTHSEVSGVTPSRAPTQARSRGGPTVAAYQSPYAETMPRDMALSRPTLHPQAYAHESYEDDASTVRSGTVMRGVPNGGAPPPLSRAQTFNVAGGIPRRPGSDPALRSHGAPVAYDPAMAAAAAGYDLAAYDPAYAGAPAPQPAPGKPLKVKEIDMNLAYGNVPPDLESRIDLDPHYQALQKEQRAHGLARHVQGLLDEAKCVGSSAGSIIKRLQGDPKAAGAVALSLAELSKLLSTMSPAFLPVLKGGSPAVFALLASPQFLIAAGVTAGVTVVMFGGWKIVKRIQAERAAKAEMVGQAVAWEATQAAPQHWPAAGSVSGTMLNGEAAEYYTGQQHAGGPAGGGGAGGPSRGGGPAGGGDRGGPDGAGGGPGSQHSFDEALVIEEELSSIETWRRGIGSFGEDESVDLELISPEAERARKKQLKDEARKARSEVRGDADNDDDTRSERSARSHRSSKSHRSTRSHKSHREHRSSRDEDRPRERERDRDRDDVSETGSHRSSRSHRSSKSKRPEKVSMLAIEDGRAQSTMDSGLEYVLRPKKDNSMLKSLFRKKERDFGRDRDGPRERERASALVF